MIKKISIKTKFGWISAFETNGKIFKIRFGKVKNQTPSFWLKKFKIELHRYFDKKNLNISKLCKIQGNKIQKKIWAELRKIRFGHTKTYGEIAKKLNLSPRYIGKICGQNKIILVIPCHRVIRSDGNLGGFSATGGVKLKKKLLDFERN